MFVWGCRTWWIRQSIQRGVAASEDTIRLPFALHDASMKVRAATSRLEAEAGAAPTVEQLAAATNLAPKRVRQVLAARVRTVSLDQQVGPEDDAGDLGAFVAIADDRPEDEAIARAAAQELRQTARRCLDQRSRLVVARRFGLAGGRPMSLDEIGDEIGKSRETVRLILKDALNTLRQELDNAA